MYEAIGFCPRLRPRGHRDLSLSTSTDHSVRYDSFAFDFSSGFAFDSNSGPDLDSVSFQNIQDSPAAPPSWTYNEFFDLLHRSMTSSTMVPISVPFSMPHQQKPTVSHRKRM
ncbi:hypothetical protein EVAR_20179_1 [Eumeta japonica]|uniref:Uncharacterized protein n=1 Tax=Eumeta variegata TaxID=151549 RepID=A0A4C1UUE8_EUMVA|nr:hypothetical protein EVAR_20179_1 [Eumeta japonica]